MKSCLKVRKTYLKASPDWGWLLKSDNLIYVKQKRSPSKPGERFCF